MLDVLRVTQKPQPTEFSWNKRGIVAGHKPGAPRGRANGHFLHGRAHSPEWNAWRNARYRCTQRSSPDWVNYGGRGITMCAEWQQSFAAFYRDVGPRPTPLHSLDRKNNDGNYEPGNVRWALKSTQNRNKRH